MGGSFNSTWAVDNAFCIRQISEPRDAYLVEERIQQADRYGGHGVGYGGGSGRCATFGIVQIRLSGFSLRRLVFNTMFVMETQF